MRSAPRRLLAASLALLLAACATGPEPRPVLRRPAVVPVAPAPAPKPAAAGAPVYVPGAAPFSERDRGPDAEEIPPGIDQVPDAVPQIEPKSRSGNSSVYEVFGKRYKVLGSADGFRERGYASWYGKKFHGRKTASGEVYDMFAMTAAHKRLPLPSFVRVTNVGNGRSTIVRVNDRGPFHKGRIIDLSYAAAAKLGILGDGHALVEIEALTPTEPGETMVAAAPPPAPASVSGAEMSALPDTPPPPAGVELRPAPGPGRGYLQIASFVDPINAVALREELGRMGIERVSVMASDLGGELLHRVVAGPFADEAAAGELRRRLRGQGYSVDWVTQ